MEFSVFITLIDINFRMISCLVRAEHSLNSLPHSSFWKISLLCEFSEMQQAGEPAEGFPTFSTLVYSKLSSSVLCHVTHLWCCDKIPGYCSLREEGLFGSWFEGTKSAKAGKAWWQQAGPQWELVAGTSQFFTFQWIGKQRKKNANFLFFSFFFNFFIQLKISDHGMVSPAWAVGLLSLVNHLWKCCHRRVQWCVS